MTSSPVAVAASMPASTARTVRTEARGARGRSLRPRRGVPDRGAAPAVEVAVTNIGKRQGVIVPQLYLTGTGQGPMRLAGFQRVALAPGETKTLAIPVDPRILARWTAGRGWAVAPGRYRLTLATDAQSPVANGEVSVAAGAQSPG